MWQKSYVLIGDCFMYQLGNAEYLLESKYIFAYENHNDLDLQSMILHMENKIKTYMEILN